MMNVMPGNREDTACLSLRFVVVADLVIICCAQVTYVEVESDESEEEYHCGEDDDDEYGELYLFVGTSRKLCIREGFVGANMLSFVMNMHTRLKFLILLAERALHSRRSEFQSASREFMQNEVRGTLCTLILVSKCRSCCR